MSEPGGKGHTQRPTDQKKWSEGYERIWAKKKREEAERVECETH